MSSIHRRAVAVSVVMAMIATPNLLDAQDLPPYVPGEDAINANAMRSYSAVYNSYEILTRRTSVFGRDIWSVLIQIDRPNGVIIDHMGWDAETLELVYHHTPYFAKGPEYVYTNMVDGVYDITRLPLQGGAPVHATGDLGTPVFVAAFLGVILGHLPLAEDYATRLPHLRAIRDSDEWTVDYTTARVTGREMVQTEVGDFDTWVVELENALNGNERINIATEPPFVIRRIRRPGTVRAFTSELVAFEERTP